MNALDSLFHGRAIAIVGASDTPGKMGYNATKALLEAGFTGNVYPINPRGGTVLGLSAFTTLAAVPDQISFAVIAVPQAAVPDAVDACGSVGVPVVQVLSSGFGELGPEGQQVEDRLLEVARRHGTRVIGPNCIGTLSASTRLTWTPRSRFVAGNVALVSQSGGLAYDVHLRGEAYGVGFTKIVSAGNCIDLDIADYVEYLRDDDATAAIALYIEGVRDGTRLYEQLRLTTKVKPVIALKGGRTASGGESIASHTGRLAGDYRIWKAMFRQAGVLEVHTPEEMVTVLQGLTYLRGLPELPRVALVGNGGGASVQATDQCIEAGLALAALTEGSRDALLELVPFVGAGGRTGNPIDLPLQQLFEGEGRLLRDILQLVAEDPGVDVTMLNLNLLPLSGRANPQEQLAKVLGNITEALVPGTAVVTLRSDGSPSCDMLKHYARELLTGHHDVPCFDSPLEAFSCLRVTAQSANRYRVDLEVR